MSAEQARTALRVALELVDHGYALTPVTLTRGPDGGKVARFHERWQRDPAAVSTDPAVVRDWHAQHGCSFAVVCEPSGVEGVDLDVKPDGDRVAWWSAQGLPVSRMRVRTLSGGEHHLYRASGGRGLPTTSKGGGLSGLDARGVGGLFYAPGAFVVGEPGHYELTDPLVKPSDLDPTPDDVLELFDAHPAGRPAGTGQCPRRGTRGVVGHWHGFTDTAARARLDEQVRGRMADAVDGVDVNTRLNDAAGEAGRFVPALWSRGEAFDYLAAALLDGPGKVNGWSTLDRNDVATINSGLNYGMTMPHCRADDDQGDGPAEPAGPDGDHERMVADRMRRKLADRDADLRLAALDRADRPRMADRLIDVRELHRIPRPSFLLGGLIPDRSVGFLFASRQSYKTFLAVSWACTLAMGRAWLDDDRFAVRAPVRVLYIAAEGPSGVAERIAAWEAANGVQIPAGMLQVFDEPVRLDNPADVADLSDCVGEGGFGLLIVDTFHRSVPGTNEDSSSEFGRVFDAVARIRDDHGCATLLLDHTGHAGERGRGTSAKGDDADYVLVIRTGQGQRRLVVDKLKDVRDGQVYPLRLRPVPQVRNADDEPSAVIEIGTSAADTFDHHGDPWWSDRLPDDVAATITGTGKVVAADVVRFLRRNVDNVDGFTREEIRTALRECPRYQGREPKQFTSTWSDGWSCVRREGAELAVPEGATASRFVLAGRLRPGAS